MQINIYYSTYTSANYLKIEDHSMVCVCICVCVQEMRNCQIFSVCRFLFLFFFPSFSLSLVRSFVICILAATNILCEKNCRALQFKLGFSHVSFIFRNDFHRVVRKISNLSKIMFLSIKFFSSYPLVSDVVQYEPL